MRGRLPSSSRRPRLFPPIPVHFFPPPSEALVSILSQKSGSLLRTRAGGLSLVVWDSSDDGAG